MNPKSRMISLRLGDQEFREIKRRCIEAGSLSVSDFVRGAMVRALESPEAVWSSSLEIRMVQLQHRLDHLESRIEELAELAAATTGHPIAS